MKEDSVRQQTILSVKWTAIERLGLQGMQFALGIIMARLLAPSDYGVIGMISIFLAISQSFMDSGFGTALIQKQNRTETDFSTVFYFNIAMAALCYLILFLIAPYVASFFRTPILCAVLRIQSINLLINSCMQVHVSKLTIGLDFKALAKRSLIATLLSGICGIIFAYYGFGVWALVFQGLISSAINLIFVLLYIRWKPRWEFSWFSFKELGSFGSKLLASGLLHTVYTNMTTLVIGRCFSSKDLGFYNRGTSFATLPVDTMNGILQKVTFPILSKIQDDNVRLIHVYRKYICVMSIPIFWGCTLLAALAKPVILLFLTEKWADAVIYLEIYAFAIMFDHICTINLNLLKVKGRSDLFLRLEIVKKIIAVAILFASIPFGIIGICISKVVYTQIAVYINTYYTGKLLGLGYWIQFKDYILYFFASVIACLPAFLFATLDLHPVMAIMFGLISSLLIYYFLLRKNADFLELKELMEEKLSRHK